MGKRFVSQLGTSSRIPNAVTLYVDPFFLPVPVYGTACQSAQTFPALAYLQKLASALVPAQPLILVGTFWCSEGEKKVKAIDLAWPGPQSGGGRGEEEMQVGSDTCRTKE